MNSPGHRANILVSYVVMGVGVAINASGIYYWNCSTSGLVADAGMVPVWSEPDRPAAEFNEHADHAGTAAARPDADHAHDAGDHAEADDHHAHADAGQALGQAARTAPATYSSGSTSDKGSCLPGILYRSTSQLVALPDTFHARPGRPRILHPLGNDQNPEPGKPLRILKILQQPRGSTARVVRHFRDAGRRRHRRGDPRRRRPGARSAPPPRVRPGPRDPVEWEERDSPHALGGTAAVPQLRVERGRRCSTSPRSTASTRSSTSAPRS